ncbi:MAG: sulfatase-like hydrolase/transferase [Acidimicrobiales bacterium]|nr:sulfatase-like hydrolase/transferase [Acidimicrobiales bacterium]
MWRVLRRPAELLALCGLAVTQPMLDTFGAAPETFTAADASAADIVVFALVLALGPALALWALELLVGLISAPAARWLHRGLLGALLAATVAIALHRSDALAPAVGLAIGVAAGVGLAWIYRYGAVRQWLAVLAVTPVLFVAVFLTASPAADLMASVEPVAAVAPPPTGAERSAVLVVFDEFPLEVLLDASGSIDADLYPNLAALAADGTWFRNATSVATVTSVAVPAMLTGRYPPDDPRTPVATDYPENLFTLLGDTYRLEVEEQVTSLCPIAICAPIPPAESADGGDAGAAPWVDLLVEAAGAWRTLLVDPDATGPVVIAEEVTAAPATAVDAARADAVELGGAPMYRVDAFDDLLASIEPDEEPTLHFLHLQLPHAPYRFLPTGQAYQSIDADGGLLANVGTRGPDEYETTSTRQRLALQAGYVDRLVGDLVQRLRDTGLYEDTALVVTSDHGVGLEPGQGKRPLFDEAVDPSIYADLLWVPLLVKAPGMAAGRVDDRNAMIIDVMPTIADVLGVEIPWEVDGLSLAQRNAVRANNIKVFNRTATNSDVGSFDVAIHQARLIDGDEHFAQMLARNLDATVRRGNERYPLYDITDGGELIGEPAGPMLVDATTGLDAQLPEVAALRDYRADAAYVPVRVTGELLGAPSADPVLLAVVVDGVVAGVAPTYRGAFADHVIDVMLPPELVQPGEHDVGVYVVDGPAGARALWPVPIR